MQTYEKIFCNTKSLNLSEHSSVSVCAPPLLPYAILFSASSAAFNKSLVFLLPSGLICFSSSPCDAPLTSCNISHISWPVYYQQGLVFLLIYFTVLLTLCSSHLKSWLHLSLHFPQGLSAEIVHSSPNFIELPHAELSLSYRAMDRLGGKKHPSSY